MRPLTASLEWRAAFRTLLLVILACSLGWSGGGSTALPPGMADRILVVKSARTMTLMRDGKVLKTYKVALSRAPVGPKEREGDHRVPEGQYVVDSKNLHSR